MKHNKRKAAIGAMKKRTWQSFLYAALSIAYECGRISRRSIEFLGGDEKWKRDSIREAVNNGYLIENRAKDMELGKNRMYEIKRRGITYLSKHNRVRFWEEKKIEKLSGDARKMIRGRKYSEMVTMLKRAGYCTHEDDKPDLYGYQSDSVVDGGPPPGFHQQSDNDLSVSLIRNTRIFRYSGEKDQTPYLQRTTPINCFYSYSDSKPISTALFQNQDNQDSEGVTAVRYARTFGLLFTPDDVYRTFHTGDSAMKIRTIGEAVFSSKMSGMANRILPDRCPTEDNTAIKPALVFGDGEMLAASKMIRFDNDVEAEWVRRFQKKMDEDANGTLLNTSNAGNPTIYIPVRKEGIDILTMMQFPNWRQLVREITFEQLATLRQDPQTLFDASLAEGGKAAFFFDMDLTKLSRMKIAVGITNIPKLLVVCADWQADFIREVFQETCVKAGTELSLYGFADWHSKIVEMLQQYWEVTSDGTV